TAADYLRFSQMLLNRGKLGETRVLGAKTVDYMTADHLDAGIQSDSLGAAFGFGLTVAVRRTTGGPGALGSPGEYTWSGSYGTNFWVEPKEQLVIVFMSANPSVTRLPQFNLVK